MSDDEPRRDEKSVADRIFGPVYIPIELRPISLEEQAKAHADPKEIEALFEEGRKNLAALEEAKYGSSTCGDLRFYAKV